MWPATQSSSRRGRRWTISKSQTALLLVYGDRKYGSPHALGPAVALHARQLTVLHPTKLDPVTLTAELPKGWKGRFAYVMNGAFYLQGALLFVGAVLVTRATGRRGVFFLLFTSAATIGYFLVATVHGGSPLANRRAIKATPRSMRRRCTAI